MTAPRIARAVLRLAPPAGAARPLTVAVVVQTVGFGLLITLSAIYFVRVVELDVGIVALAFSVAAMGGIAAGVVVGHLSDRYDPRGIAVMLLSATSIAVLGHVVVANTTSLFVVLSLYQFADRGAAAARGTLIARAVPSDKQVQTRSYLRAVSNIGFAVGAGLAAWALVSDTRVTYVWLIAAAALSYAFAAMIIAVRIRRVPPIPRANRAPVTTALRDRRFMIFATTNALLSLQFAVLEFGMPIWVTQHTDAPGWMVTVLFVTNTALVTLLQVRMGRSSETLAGAVRTHAVGGLLLGLACVLLGLAGYVPMWFAAATLVAAGILHAFGEMAQGASSWAMAFELAPANAHGQYQGLFATSTSIGLVAGSSIIAFVALSWGLPGWILLGGVFVMAGVALPVAFRFMRANIP